MANIEISNLHPAGSDLFSDSESYMNNLTDSHLDTISGGIIPALFVVPAMVAVNAAAASSNPCAVRAGVAVGAAYTVVEQIRG